VKRQSPARTVPVTPSSSARSLLRISPAAREVNVHRQKPVEADVAGGHEVGRCGA